MKALPVTFGDYRKERWASVYYAVPRFSRQENYDINSKIYPYWRIP
jgi:hypothetical protein